MIDFCALALVVQSHSQFDGGIRPSTGHVYVVGGPGGIATIQGAIDAAEDGDTVLVKTGNYEGFSISNKDLAVVADESAIVSVQGSVRVDDLSAGKSALVAGFLVYGSVSEPAFSALHDAGSLRVEDCTIYGANGLPWTAPQHGVLLHHDANVAFVSCTLEGGRGASTAPNEYDGGPGQAAFQSFSSSVAIQDSLLRGGPGGKGLDAAWSFSDGGIGGPGAASIRLTDGFGYFGGSSIIGGRGGDGGDNYHMQSCFGSGAPGDGGPGGSCVQVISAAPPNPNVVLFGDSLSPGMGGDGGYDWTQLQCWGGGNPGAPGIAIVAPPGTVSTLPGASRRVAAPRVARENTSATMSCHGQPGDVVQIYAANSLGFSYQAQFRGVNLTSFPQAVLLVSGTIPASGALDLHVPLGSIEVESKRLYLQAYFRDTANQRYISSQLTFVELDSAY